MTKISPIIYQNKVRRQEPNFLILHVPGCSLEHTATSFLAVPRPNRLYLPYNYLCDKNGIITELNGKNLSFANKATASAPTQRIHTWGIRETIYNKDGQSYYFANENCVHFANIGGLEMQNKVAKQPLTDAYTYTESQKESTIAFLKNYIKNINPNIKILGHNQIANKSCPCLWTPDFLEQYGIPAKNIMEHEFITGKRIAIYNHLKFHPKTY